VPVEQLANRLELIAHNGRRRWNNFFHCLRLFSREPAR
jgi:hypothetical protein